MNKTEHIDCLLKHNLTLEEIRLSQVYSMVSAIEKVMIDMNLPQVIGQVGNLSRLSYLPKKNEKEIKITTLLRDSYEPILIYSSGSNDLMREVGTNHFCIKKDYKNRTLTPNYYYALDQIEDSRTIEKVINSIDKNFYNILSVNPNADIYTLGAYIPKTFNSEQMKMFREFILKYNEELTKLCNSYNITFVEPKKSDNKYTNKKYKKLAIDIINSIYDKKFILEKNSNNKNYNDFEITNLGSEGMIETLNKESLDYFKEVMQWQDYYAFRKYLIVIEKERETRVFEKVYNKAQLKK